MVRLELTLFDREGRFFAQRRLDSNGDSSTMSILTVPNRVLPAKGRLVVFNPFARFAADAWLGDLRYEATFRAGEDGPEQSVALTVRPEAFVPATRLTLPLRGETFVHDGHDLTAHHRETIALPAARSDATGTASSLSSTCCQ